IAIKADLAGAVGKGMVSASALALAEGVINIMWWNKAKHVALVVIFLALIASGAGWYGLSAMAGPEQAAPDPNVVRAQASPADGDKEKKPTRSDINKLQGAGRDGHERGQPGKEEKQPVSLWQRIDIQTMHIKYAGEKPDQAPIGLKVGTFDF